MIRRNDNISGLNSPRATELYVISSANFYDVIGSNKLHIIITISTHWDRDQMADISQATVSHAFSWIALIKFRQSFPKIVPEGPIDNIPSLVQIMAWRRRIYASLGLNEWRWTSHSMCYFFIRSIKIYLLFILSHHTEIKEVVEILPRVRQEHTDST